MRTSFRSNKKIHKERVLPKRNLLRKDEENLIDSPTEQKAIQIKNTKLQKFQPFHRPRLSLLS